MALRGVLLCAALICAASISDVAKSDEPSVRDQQLEVQALKAYKTACLRVQELADWMAVFLKIKGLWTKSISRNAMDGEVTQLVNRVKRDTKGPFSCASFKNLRLYAQKYIESQSELLRITASAGSSLLKSGRAMLEESTNSLRVLNDGIRNLFLTNSTPSNLVSDLRNASRTLSHQFQSERARALGFLQDARNGFGFLRFWTEDLDPSRLGSGAHHSNVTGDSLNSNNSSDVSDQSDQNTTENSESNADAAPP